MTNIQKINSTDYGIIKKEPSEMSTSEERELALKRKKIYTDLVKGKEYFKAIFQDLIYGICGINTKCYVIDKNTNVKNGEWTFSYVKPREEEREEKFRFPIVNVGISSKTITPDQVELPLKPDHKDEYLLNFYLDKWISNSVVRDVSSRIEFKEYN